MRCRKGLQSLCAAISLLVSTTSVERVSTSFRMLRTAVVVVYAASAMLLYSAMFWRYIYRLVGYADDVAPRDSRHSACGTLTNKYSSKQNPGRRVQIVLPYSLVCSRCSIVPIAIIYCCNPYSCMRLFVGHTTETRHGPIQRTYEYACMCEACTGFYRSLD